jgi:hypothetical protein
MVVSGEKSRELEGNMLRGNCVHDESNMKSPGDEIEAKWHTVKTTSFCNAAETYGGQYPCT